MEYQLLTSPPISSKIRQPLRSILLNPKLMGIKGLILADVQRFGACKS